MKLLTSSIVFVQLAAVLSTTSWASPISTQQLESVAAKGYRLLDLQPGVEPVWKTEEEKLELLRQGVHFVCLPRLLIYSIAYNLTTRPV